MARGSFRRVAVCTAVVAGLFGLSLVNAGGASAAGSFTCRASAARIQTGGLLGIKTIEPTVVQGQPCTSTKTLVNATVLELAGVRVAYASARAEGTGHHPRTNAEVVNVSITALGLPNIEATVLRAEAFAGGCSAGTPALTSSSQVIGLKVGGQAVVVDGNPVTLNLGAATLSLNKKITTSTSVTQRALDLKTALGVNVVLAEAKVGYTGNPCTP